VKKIITQKDKDSFGKRPWVQLVNSLSGFKSCNLIGTCNESKETNLAIVSSVIHLGSDPALIGFILRPHSSESPRHTLLNIEQTKHYTINHVTNNFYKKAHQTSARYGIEESEFFKCELEEEWHDNFIAPFVKESPIQIGLKLLEVKYIEQNKTNFVIGEVQKIILQENIIKKDGYLDLESANIVCTSGLDSYHETKRLNRLSYAKPSKAVANLNTDGENL